MEISVVLPEAFYYPPLVQPPIRIYGETPTFVVQSQQLELLGGLSDVSALFGDISPKPRLIDLYDAPSDP